MTTMWGVHNDQPQLGLVEHGFISIGWPAMGDMTSLPEDREAVKDLVAAAYPDAKRGAIPNYAGTLLAFRHTMQPGDLVVYPHRPDSTLNFGRIASDYYYDANAGLHRNRRRVEWLRVDVPRSLFSETARYELGAAITVFQVRRHRQELDAFLRGAEADPDAPSEPVSIEDAEEVAADKPNAARIEAYTRDYVVERLHKDLEGVDFEHFVAHLLQAMGYQTRVTQASGDGGVDIVAHRDALGLEPPIIKVQCKLTLKAVGGPVVQQLVGTLAPNGAELGLCVTLGTFTRDAEHIARTRQELRLVNGKELVDLIFRHYEKFSPEYKRLLPMRSVYIVDEGDEA